MTQPRILDRRAIFAAPQIELETETVDMPEWGGAVLVRAFTAADTDAVQRVRNRKANGRPVTNTEGLVRAQAVIRGVINPDGSRVFTNDDEPYLSGLPIKVINRIIMALTRLNGGDEIDAETEGNFEDDQESDSSTN